MFDIMLALVLFEFYEISWQKADTIMGMLAKMYEVYRKNLVLFLLKHPSYIISVYILLKTNYDFFAIVLVVLKSLDILTKIVFMQKIFDENRTNEVDKIFYEPMPKFFPYIGLGIYPFLAFYAIKASGVIF